MHSHAGAWEREEQKNGKVYLDSLLLLFPDVTVKPQLDDLAVFASMKNKVRPIPAMNKVQVAVRRRHKPMRATEEMAVFHGHIHRPIRIVEIGTELIHPDEFCQQCLIGWFA